MSDIAFHGRLDPAPAPPELGVALPGVTVRAKASARLGRARAGEPRQVVRADASDVVELELGDGLRLWLRVEDLARDFRLATTRGAAAEVIEIPEELPVAARSRGVGEWVVHGLRLLGIDIAGTITELVSKEVEGRLVPGPGLYRCTAGPAAEWRPAEDAPLPGGAGPTLVLVHGTASSTEGSFGPLWDGGRAARIRELLEHYRGRVVAFQHRTLTESPIANALDLAKRLARLLPANAEVHLATHSRGGLVGELLARGMRVDGVAFDERDLALFAASHRRDAEALAELGELLARAPLRIGRFVRVACPARGTTLAGGRLDRYFSLLTNLVGSIPVLRQSPLYDGIRTVLAGVLARRTDPDELPGLEAMMPGSALVRLLNRADVATRADLHVLGGDFEGGGLWGRLAGFATDLFYREDHDLVVNTPAMFGGIPRETGRLRYWIDAGSEVTHFHYFGRADTARRLVSALVAKEPPPDFRELEAVPAEVGPGDYAKRAAAVQPIVVVLPGIMGSTLQANQDLVWVHFARLATGGLARIAAGAPAVAASGLVADAYRDLVRHLAATHEVVPFPYDWRGSIAAAGERLATTVKDLLDRAEKHRVPIRFLAHSMGGLVFRAMLASEEGKEVWRRVCEHPGARAVLLGTPTAGAHAIAAMWLGRDRLTRRLALVDVVHDFAELLAIIAGFDGVLELLPKGGSCDLFDPRTWAELHDHDVDSLRGLFSKSAAGSKSAGVAWAVPSAERLERARRIRAHLEAVRFDPARTIYVAGCADETPCDITIDPAARPGRRVTVHATAHGDGRVPWATGIPEELAAQTYYMDEEHGDLACAERHFPALVDLLTKGDTTKLRTAPPQRRTKAAETFPIEPESPPMVPDREDLVAAALGSSGRRPRRAPRERPVRVRVVHGNLAGATSPVVVGHYEHDVLVHAERVLDRQLGGRLSELHRMDIYPGRIGTAATVLNELGTSGGAHPGAVVVGLGTVGELDPRSLIAALAHGFVTYASEQVGIERRRRQRDAEDGGSPLELSLTVLLVGSGEGGVTVADSVRAILRAVRTANDRLALGRGGRSPSTAPADAAGAASLVAAITAVDVLELYEDRAIQAVRALNRIARATALERFFVVEERLVEGRGGRIRESFEEAVGWWSRIRIAAAPRDPTDGSGDEALKFEAITDRARAPAYLRPAQRALVEKLLRRSSATTAADAEIGHTLFELLLPPELKALAPERRRLALLLDESAARYPWELLHDRYDSGARPLSVESGLVRQLLTPRDVRPSPPPGDAALVVGDPAVADPRFPSLSGAEKESRAVADLLENNGFAVDLRIGAEAEPDVVFSRLHARPWRVIHLAAHGVVDFRRDGGSAPVTGVVLNDGVVITPAEIAQLRFAPDLVFINCCHLGDAAGEAGRPAVEYHRLAANVATQLIRMGVRAVIAAGWAVDDTAAELFATTFYASLLDGCELGDAVIAARQAVYEATYPRTNTWGAYQCYGDPSFQLRPGGSNEEEEPPVAAREACRRFTDLALDVREASPEGLSLLAKRFDAIVRRCDERWLRAADVAAAIAAVHAALGARAKAIELYRIASRAERADVPLRAIEDLAELTVRSASSASGSARRTLFREAEKLVDALIAIGPTAGRYRLRGELHRRRATASKGKARQRALEAMAEAYKEARRVAAGEGGDAAWALTEELGAEVALAWRNREKGSKRGAVARRLAALRTSLRDLDGAATGFREHLLPAVHDLLAALLRGSLDEATRQRIEESYRTAQRHGGGSEVDAVVEHVRFLARMLDRDTPEELRKRLRRGLARLAAALSEGRPHATAAPEESLDENGRSPTRQGGSA